MKAIKSGPPREVLLDLLDYDPSTGLFRRKKAPGNDLKVGSVAGYLDGNGYCSIKLLRKAYLAHRLAWLYVHGEWPSLLVDHINGVRTDNRIANLRLVTYQQNRLNRGAQQGRTEFPSYSGGISRDRYRARININGKNIHLGSFETEAEAVAAYEAAVKRLEQGVSHGA